MALQFKVETLDDKVKLTVKGVVIELSYHAASALCNTIFSECDKRKEFQSNKFNYWREQGRNGKKVKVRPANQKKYDEFVASTEKKERKPSKPYTPMKLEERSEKILERARAWQANRDRIARQRAKIRELQERFGITPKSSQSE